MDRAITKAAKQLNYMKSYFTPVLALGLLVSSVSAQDKPDLTNPKQKMSYAVGSLVQFRTTNSLCRKCHKPLDIEEPVALTPQLVVSAPVPASAEAGLQVAGQVRDIRKARHLSQRQLAGRMQVPRTYISKIENGKAIPTLGSLERLAAALEVDVCQLVRDARSRRDEEVAAILADPFLSELAALLPQLDSLHRTLIYGSVRDAATGRRRTA